MVADAPAINFLTCAADQFKISVQVAKINQNSQNLRNLIQLISRHICIFNTRPSDGDFICLYDADGTFAIQGPKLPDKNDAQ